MKSKFFFYLSLVILLSLGGYRLVSSIQADQDYLGYLKRAADANSIELAKEELSRALMEIEKQGLTEGYTNILWKTPKDDVGFWYKNLESSLVELEDLPENSSPLEKSNMLIKLRETLLDGSKEGDQVTYPPGISIYPNNKPVAFCFVFFGIVLFFSAGLRNILSIF